MDVKKIITDIRTAEDPEQILNRLLEDIRIEERFKQKDNSPQYHQGIQETRMPGKKLLPELFPDSFMVALPADGLSDDFFWIEEAGDLVLFAVGDCMGYGVPGAIMAAICPSALSVAVKDLGITDPGEILDKVNDLLIDVSARLDIEKKDGMDISLCVLNRHTKELNWSGANTPLLYVHKGLIDEIEADKQAVGRYDNNNFTTHRRQLSEGSCLYLFSDGYFGRFDGEKGKKVMYKQLRERLSKTSNLSMRGQKECLHKIIEIWHSELKRVDDMMVVGIRL